MKKPIYLYGFMGCGKSYLGRKAANAFGLSFVDLDDYIVKREGAEIAEIFRKNGKMYFKSLELSALSEVRADIISLGGGALNESPGAAAYAKKHAVVVFINTDFDACYGRIKSDGAEKRPNAAGKTKEELFALYNSRIEHYREVADYTIKGEDEWSFIMQELKQW
ncbi:MAG: shikimate kinase [Oscillospiraceae bacterium]|jgi:shikimate kinase|nr:shikimate kinase [Oscillospiraceae bacterium]